MVFGLTLAYRFLGFAREAILAAFLGNSPAADAYYIAYSIPYVVVNIVALGSIASAAVPILTPFVETGDKAGLTNFIGRALGRLLPALTLICALLIVLAEPMTKLFAPGFDHQTRALAVNLTRVMTLMILPLGLSGLYSAISLAHKNFGITPAANFIFNSVMVLGGLTALMLNNLQVLAGSVLVAALSQFFFNLMAVSRQQSVGFQPAWGLTDHPLTMFIKALSPICLSVALTMANPVIGRAMASGLDSGSIASLNYAEKVYQLPLGVLVGAAAGVMLPFLSRAIASEDMLELRKLYDDSRKALGFLLAPIILILVFFSVPVINVLFERGHFGPEDSLRTAGSLRWFALALPGAMLMEITNRVFYAFSEAKKTFYLALLITVANAILAFAFSRSLGQNGIAIALAVSVSLGYLAARLMLSRSKAGLEIKMNIGASLKTILALIIMTVGVFYLASPVNHFILQQIWIARVALLVATTIGLYILFALLLNLFGVMQLKAIWFKLKAKRAR